MSNENHNDQHGQREQLQHGGWQPTPQGGEYDAEATAFVHLPPEDLADIPLAAPGHGYVPPMILPLTPAAGLDPAAAGSWAMQTQSQQERGTGAEQPASDAVHWPDPNQQQPSYGYEYPQQEQYRETPAATGQWNFTESAEFGGYADHSGQAGHAASADHGGQSGHSAQPGHSGHAEPAGHTGQWTIPVADGDLPEESGEFAASALASQWYADRTPPATLPGGAPAPWATQQPVADPEPEPAVEQSAPGADVEPEHAPGADSAPAVEASAYEESTLQAPEAAPRTAAGDVPVPAAGDTPALGVDLAQAPAPDTVQAADTAPAPDTVHAADTAPAPDTVPAADTPAEHPVEAAPEHHPAEPPADTAPDSEPDTAPDTAPDAPPLDTPPEASPLPSEHPAVSYVLHVNGADRPVTDAWIGESLLYVLRERLGLAGAKDGCSQGECGACNVQVDGRLVASCLVPAATAAGSEVRTVEGLAVDGEPSDVQRALAKCGAVQCGFCIPGMAMTVHDLLEGNHAPSELETRQALCGNLCRCSGYRGVLDAVNEVIAGREAINDPASSDSSSPEPDEARIPHQAAPGAGSVQPHLQDGGMA
ncbi:2Fe-2S iron-sulfur cluster-binding protein [Streptomyces sp. BE133]|uniref:2Fe-2S iron-sulfur cluster-binding protein n=1 Tax=Streptomyces sp. BE133 TaxID=3002523 RepID=UPI002E76D16B|nr:2Fe-2S iron-sulfur cluster-binding protein [Streptomyces sp. BE133]MEE1809595.1 2Fe-2S iron-sulfur cluster-binding protein [Streptomyces sp. BE133]